MDVGVLVEISVVFYVCVCVLDCESELSRIVVLLDDV